jgi:hypothetical protein
MIEKHRHLPTSTLYLVSWSGFSADALVLARAESGVVPVVLNSIHGNVTLISQEMTVDLARMEFHVDVVSSRSRTIEVSASEGKSMQIYSSEGQIQGSAWQLGTWLCRQPGIFLYALEQVSQVPNRQEIRSGELILPAKDLPPDIWLRIDENLEFSRVAGLRVVFEAAFKEQVLSLQPRAFLDARFGHANARIGGVEHAVVATLNPSLEVIRLGTELAVKP